MRDGILPPVARIHISKPRATTLIVIIRRQMKMFTLKDGSARLAPAKAALPFLIATENVTVTSRTFRQIYARFLLLSVKRLLPRLRIQIRASRESRRRHSNNRNANRAGVASAVH